MRTYLPDTNAFSGFLRGHHAALTAKMKAAMAAGELRLSAMVLAELEFGARKAQRTLGTTRFVEKVGLLKSVFEIDPIGPGFPEAYALVRDTLEAQGVKIGDRDTIIAAHALCLDAIVVSRNMDEFTRVAGLRVENWET